MAGRGSRRPSERRTSFATDGQSGVTSVGLGGQGGQGTQGLGGDDSDTNEGVGTAEERGRQQQRGYPRSTTA